MEQPAKTCPKCGRGDYMFRSRKKIEVASDSREESGLETLVWTEWHRMRPPPRIPPGS
jgi:hypothetical protein